MFGYILVVVYSTSICCDNDSRQTDANFSMVNLERLVCNVSHMRVPHMAVTFEILRQSPVTKRAAERCTC